MGRPTTTNLTNRLADPHVWTQSTVDLLLTNSTQYHFSTAAFTGTNGTVYTDDLRRVGEIKQSVSQSVDRVQISIQNVDKVFGDEVPAEALIKATAIVGRQYGGSEIDSSLRAWAELFRGEVRPISMDENEVVIEVVNDLAAAGFCVAHWSLAENCQFVYKHAGTCGYAGGIATCNKRRKSPAGCLGHDNEHHFGGMEFPDSQTTTPPTGDDPGDGGGGWIPCPRTDQFVLVRAHWTSKPRPKRVSMLGSEDELYNPVTGVFAKIKSIRFVPDEPIFSLQVTEALGFSSGSHPIIQSIDDHKGIAVQKMTGSESVLIWSKGDLSESSVAQVLRTSERATVAKIELVSGHIYAYGDTSSGPFIVCHNSKPGDDGGGGGIFV